MKLASNFHLIINYLFKFYKHLQRMSIFNSTRTYKNLTTFEIQRLIDID